MEMRGSGSSTERVGACHGMPVRAIALLCVLGSFSAPSAFAQPTTSASPPPLRPHPIGESETVQLLLDMLERFVPRCEAAWREGGLTA